MAVRIAGESFFPTRGDSVKMPVWKTLERAVNAHFMYQTQQVPLSRLNEP